MVYTPGLVRAARATAKTDRLYWINVFHEGYEVPPDAAAALVMSEVPFTLEDDGQTVVFTHPATEA